MSDVFTRHLDGLLTHHSIEFLAPATPALEQGMGMCLNIDYGTITTREGSRMRRVEPPSANNALYFAGYLDMDYAASDRPRKVRLYPPGSTCLVAAGLDTAGPATVVPGTLLTVSCLTGVDAGRSTWGGLEGAGSARALETDATVVLASSVDGTGSINDTTLTDASENFTTLGVAAGDRLIVVAHDQANTAVAGEYVVATVGTTTLTTTALMSAGAAACVYYIIRGNPLVLCETQGFPFCGLAHQSGLQEWSGVDAVSAAVADPIINPMNCGYTNIMGGITPSTGDTTAALAAPPFIGAKKGFHLRATITTHDYLLTITGNGIQADGTSALATLELDAADDRAVLGGGHAMWYVESLEGPAQA